VVEMTTKTKTKPSHYYGQKVRWRKNERQKRRDSTISRGSHN